MREPAISGPRPRLMMAAVMLVLLPGERRAFVPGPRAIIPLSRGLKAAQADSLPPAPPHWRRAPTAANSLRPPGRPAALDRSLALQHHFLIAAVGVHDVQRTRVVVLAVPLEG